MNLETWHTTPQVPWVPCIPHINLRGGVSFEVKIFWFFFFCSNRLSVISCFQRYITCDEIHSGSWGNMMLKMSRSRPSIPLPRDWPHNRRWFTRLSWFRMQISRFLACAMLSVVGRWIFTLHWVSRTFYIIGGIPIFLFLGEFPYFFLGVGVACTHFLKCSKPM